MTRKTFKENKQHDETWICSYCETRLRVNWWTHKPSTWCGHPAFLVS